MSDVPAKPRGVPLPPVIYAAALALAAIINVLVPLPWFTSPVSDILVAVGWLILLAAATLIFTAVRTMRRARNTLHPNGSPDHLMTAGPFGVSRNPMYLAQTLALIGIGLVAGIVWFLPLAVIAAFMTQKLVIEREEKLLATKFGKRYRDYAKRVRRWI